MMRNRIRRREVDVAELDVTPFMNLMIVLVPVLLLSMVFTHTTIIDLDFPAGGEGSDAPTETLYLEVSVLPDRLVIADDRGPIKTLMVAEDGYDYVALSETMQSIKARYPAKDDVVLLLTAETDYQTLVTVMDTVRTKTIEGTDLVQPLFPSVSLGDAPGAGS